MKICELRGAKLRGSISIFFLNKIKRGFLAALLAMAVLFAALPNASAAALEPTTMYLTARHFGYSDVDGETDTEIFASTVNAPFMSILVQLYQDAARKMSPMHGEVEICGVRIYYTDGEQVNCPAQFAVTHNCELPDFSTPIMDGEYFVGDDETAQLGEPCEHGFHIWLSTAIMGSEPLGEGALVYVDAFYRLLDDESSGGNDSGLDLDDEGGCDCGCSENPDCECGCFDDRLDDGGGLGATQPPGAPFDSEPSGESDDDDDTPNLPPQVYVPPMLYPPQVAEPIADAPTEEKAEGRAAEPVSGLKVDPSVAEYVGGVEIPAELAGIVKAISVAPLAEGDLAAFRDFASGGVGEDGEQSNPMFELTSVVFDLTLEGEDDAVIRELETPIKVTLNVPEGQDPTRLVLLTRHDGELTVISDIEVSEDGKTITVALNKFSPFAVAQRNANVISTDIGHYGSMNPSGDVPLKYGQTRVFTFSPQAGYMVGEVLLDGEPAQLRNDGALVVTCNEKPRSIAVTFVAAPMGATKVPSVGDELELFGDVDAATGLELVPQSDLNAALEAAEKPPAMVDRPPVVDLGREQASTLVPESVGIVDEPLAAEQRSVLNLAFALLCLVLPFLDFFVSPTRRRALKSARTSNILLGLLVVVGIASFVLVTVLERNGSQYILVNARTPLFAILFALPLVMFVACRFLLPLIRQEGRG